MYPLMYVRLESTAGQVKEFPRRAPHVHIVIFQPTFCPFRIWYIFVLLLKHLLLERLLTVLYPLLVRYVCAPYYFRDDLHHH